MQYKAIFMIFLSTLLVACDLERNPTTDSQDMELPEDSSMDFTLTGIASKGLELLEDSSVDFTLTGTASNGGELTYEIVSAVPAEAGLLFLTPEGDGRFEAKPDFYGTTQFTFSVSDGQRTAAPVTVAIKVKSVPDLASARYKNATASDSSVPWTALEANWPQGEGVVISADGITMLDRAFELTAEHENGDEITFSVVEESLPAGISFSPDGTGTINTGTTGTGHFSFHVVIHGQNGTSAPIPVNINASYIIPPPTLWSYYQIDALNPLPLDWSRYRLGEAANKVIFALTLTNMNSVDWGISNDLQFTVNFGGVDAAEPDKVVLSVYAPSPEDVLIGPYSGQAGPPLLDKAQGGSTVTFTQAAFNTDTILLVVENLGAAEAFAFDLSVVPEVKRTLRGELYDAFGGLTIPNNSIVFSPLGSITEETVTGIEVRCNDARCELNKPATGETGYCGYEAERGVGYPTCTFLDNTGTISSACQWMITGSTDENGYFISAYQCRQVFDFSGSDSTIQIPEPLVIPTYTPSIEVTVPDGGGYLGGDATYLGSIVTPTDQVLLESALTGSVSQLYIPVFVSEFQAYVNNDASADPNVAAYFNALVALNLSSGDTLTRLLDDLSDPNGSNNENAATVLMAFMPKWILELTKHTRAELTGDEIAIIATAMHHINVRREQLVATAESNLEAYRSSQPQCIALSCLFAMEGFPSVIEQSVADVDAAWVGALATGAVAGTVAGVAIVAVTMAAQTTAVFIFPHTAAVLATTLGGAGATVGGVAALAALPVTVIVIAAISTYMAVDNLLVAGENEQAYNAFINENSVQFTNIDNFINHDYQGDAKLLSEIVIASQKMMLEAFM